MRLRRSQQNGIGQSSVLSDMAFLLIIYFIVIAGFNVNKGFLLNLPKKNTVKTVPQEELLRFNIDSGGNLLFNGSRIQTADAEQKIAGVKAARQNIAVVLTVSPDAPWQSVVSFTDLAQKLAVDAFSFSMEQAAGQNSVVSPSGGAP